VRDSAFAPLNLVWSYTHPAVLEHLPAGPPEIGKHCGFFRVVNDGNPLIQFLADASLYEVADDGRWSLPTRKPKGKYRGTLAITADNAKIAYLNYEITYNCWCENEQEMRDKGLSTRLWRARRPEFTTGLLRWQLPRSS
jgi:hypothetical protein